MGRLAPMATVVAAAVVLGSCAGARPAADAGPGVAAGPAVDTRVAAHSVRPTAAPADRLAYADARHLLVRTGFAPTEAEVRAYTGLGREQAVDRLLSGARSVAHTPPPSWTAARAAELADFRAQRDRAPEERAEFLRRQTAKGLELRAWWLEEMSTTASPLTERMTLFWHNHFVSSQLKVRLALLLYEQNVVLRRHAVGNFASLLRAVARDPAMLLYLDSAQNRKGAPNENFARELMELFTLGEGHYTETDVKEAARAFTGWSVDREEGSFRFYRGQHDAGAKTVLGVTGRLDGDEVIGILLAHPGTARLVARKLWLEFVSPDPDDAAVDRVADALRASGYDLPAALRALLLAEPFWDARNRATLVRSPAELVVGTVRQFGLGTEDYAAFAIAAAGMGQNLFSPPNVKGWPGGDAWIDARTLLARKQFLERVFRTDLRSSGEPAARPRGDTRPPEMSTPGAGAAVAAQAGQRFEAGMRQIRFDSAAWLAGLGAGDTARATAVALLLPMPPTRRVLASEPLAFVRETVLDPAYQLK